MESSSDGRGGEIASDISVILVTAAQLIFFTRFHRYIAWYSRGADGTVTRLSLLADDYFTWLPFLIAASILVIVTLMVTVVYDNRRFREIAWIGFGFIGIAMVVSLLTISPFDFSVIPHTRAANVLPKAVTAFLVFMGIFYATTALVQLVRWLRQPAEKDAV